MCQRHLQVFHSRTGMYMQVLCLFWRLEMGLDTWLSSRTLPSSTSTALAKCWAPMLEQRSSLWEARSEGSPRGSSASGITVCEQESSLSLSSLPSYKLIRWTNGGATGRRGDWPLKLGCSSGTSVSLGNLHTQSCLKMFGVLVVTQGSKVLWKLQL